MEHLIPQEWFTDLSQPILLLIVAVSLGTLAKGADWLVEGAAGIAYRFGMPKVIVGATIVSLGTTSPEFAVSVMAAWSGEAGLALGNAVGSIIADTGLIFGLGCMITVLPADKFVLTRQGWVQVGAAALLAAICYFAFVVQGDRATIGRGIGILFIVLLLGYLLVSVRWSRQHPMASGGGEHEPGEESRPLRWMLAWIFVGLVLVLFASHVLICSVMVLAERWGVPQVVIAGSIVAFGTSLPELMIGMTSLRKGHKELLVGNVIGADILNVLFVIGGASVAAKLPIIDHAAVEPRIFLLLHLPVMLIILILFRCYIHAAVKEGQFRRWYGVPMVLIYLAFILAPFLMGRR